jgi:signal transduction histidine kinase/ActR/RegA family two-component response regulator
MITFQSIPEAIPIGIAAVLSSVLAIFAWRRRKMPMAPAFAMMMAGETAWALGAALEPIIVELALKRACIDFRILGTITAILGLSAFVFRYSGLFRSLRTLRFAAVCAPAIPLVLLAWTDPLHHLYWAQLTNERVGESMIAIRSFGPGFWATVAYCYVLVGVSTVLLAGAVIRFTGVYRAQAAVMLFGVLVPWMVEILDMARMIRFIPVDLVSPTFLLTGLSFLPALYRFNLLNLPPVAWALVVNGMDDPVVVIDPRGQIVELNPAAERLIGRKSPEVTGALADVVFASWPAVAAQLRRVQGNERGSAQDGADPSPDSSFDPRISPLGDEVRPSGWVLVLRDISGLKRAEDERVRTVKEQAARAEAEAANRAKDRFLATLSHELRTPLSPILVTVTAMLEDPATPEAFQPVLEMIRRNVSLEARLIDDLLDLTRIRSGQLHLQREIIDVHTLVHHVVEICRDGLQSARVALVLDLAARRHDLDADPARLQQVLWNLINNAIKFTPPGGTVTVRSRESDPSSAGTNGTGLILEVSDTGIGIEPDFLPRIFDGFGLEGLSSARRSGGLGLGLLISRSIARQHGGHIWAASGGRNLGATFTVLMPSVVDPPAKALSSEPISTTLIGRREPLTILLVEDNADTLNFLSKILTLRGAHVRTANNLQSALQVASEAKFDVLISDIELPDGSGLELMWRLRATQAVNGIALSGFGSSEDIKLSRAAGFAEHLTKPVDLRRLENAIQQVVAGNRVEGLFQS